VPATIGNAKRNWVKASADSAGRGKEWRGHILTFKKTVWV
jgi:hypothetical protein